MNIPNRSPTVSVTDFETDSVVLLSIAFSLSHDEQEKLGKQFQNKSVIGIHKPTDAGSDTLGFGLIKFVSCRKKKFDLNMQEVCDARRRFLWVDISYPGTTNTIPSLLSLFTMVFASLGMLPTQACLHFSLFCVAYGIIRDDLNFFQSQLRINIECSIGLRVHRFGMLFKAFQMGVLVSKTNSDLCKP